MGGVFKNEFDCGMEVVNELFHVLELFGGAWEDQEDVIYESLPKRDCPDEGFLDGFFVATDEKVGIWWGRFESHRCANILEKTSAHE